MCVVYGVYVVSLCVSGVFRKVKKEALGEAVCKPALKPGPAPLIGLDSSL